MPLGCFVSDVRSEKFAEAPAGLFAGAGDLNRQFFKSGAVELAARNGDHLGCQGVRFNDVS